MGFKNWLARHTTKPSYVARAYTSGLIELVEYLTASLIAFSGKKAFIGKVERTAFENAFEMDMAGFEVFDDTITDMISPSIEEIKTKADRELLYNTFKATTAFLCLAAENAAHKYMKPENATLFSTALYSFVIERSAGRFGFSSDPRQVAKTINELLPLFRCERRLNRQSFGKDDSFGLLINHLSFSRDGWTKYGFVVGSEKQSFGCGTAMLKVVLEIDASLKRCATDLHW